MKTKVLMANEMDEAVKWLEENKDELKDNGITESSLMDDISSFMKDAPQTNEFVARPKGSCLTDLIKFVKEVRDDFDKIETTNTKTIAMAIDKILDKIEDYPYSIKEAALKRYMQVLGLDYYFLLEFNKPSEKQEFDAIFAADTEALQSELEDGRARYTTASTITKCRDDKQRNCDFKQIELPTDFDESTTAYYELCESILDSLNIRIPRHELLLPKVCEAVLRENMELIKAAEVKDEYSSQQTREDEEVSPEFETTSGYKRVQKEDAQMFWKMRRERCFGEFNVLKITPLKGIDLNEKRYFKVRKATEELHKKIMGSKDYGIEDFKKLYFI